MRFLCECQCEERAWDSHSASFSVFTRNEGFSCVFVSIKKHTAEDSCACDRKHKVGNSRCCAHDQSHDRSAVFSTETVKPGNVIGDCGRVQNLDDESTGWPDTVRCPVSAAGRFTTVQAAMAQLGLWWLSPFGCTSVAKAPLTIPWRVQGPREGEGREPRLQSSKSPAGAHVHRTVQRGFVLIASGFGLSLHSCSLTH